MKKRYAAQFVFCSPAQVLRRTVVEQDENQIVTGLFSLDGQQVETSHTSFFDGILSSGIISLKENVSGNELITLAAAYNYVDLSAENPLIPEINDLKPLVLDFGTSTLTDVNRILSSNVELLSAFPAFDIIAACTYYPAIILNKSAEIMTGAFINLLLWQHVDLINKKITEKTAVKSPEHSI